MYIGGHGCFFGIFPINYFESWIYRISRIINYVLFIDVFFHIKSQGQSPAIFVTLRRRGKIQSNKIRKPGYKIRKESKNGGTIQKLRGYKNK